MRAITADVGERLRIFREECKNIVTKELNSEKEKRMRRKAKGGKGSGQVTEGGDRGDATTKGKGKGKGKARATGGERKTKGTDEKTSVEQQDRNKKTFNMHTYKFHELGHYVETIFPFGTLDNTSTQWVRLLCSVYKFQVRIIDSHCMDRERWSISR